LLVLSSTSALAVETPSELDFFAPIPTISMATRLPGEVLDTPAAVTILDREIIQASSALTIPDLLRLVPGLQVAHATGALLTVTRHGVGDQLGRRLEVMVNGNAVYLATNASVDWNMLGVAIEDIDRIEVVRSPNAPAFGGNAMFGSINIITRKPFELAGAYLRATGGSIDTAIGVARLGGRMGALDAVGTVQYIEDNGFDLVNDDKRINNLRLHGTLDLGSRDSLDIEIGYSDGEAGADGVGSAIEPFRDFKLRDSYQALTWRRTEPNGAGHRLALTYRSTTQDDSYQALLAPGLYLPLGYQDTEADRIDLEFEQRLAAAEDWRFLWGLGARYDRIRSDLFLVRHGGEVSAWTGRAVVSAEWRPLERLVANLNALTEFHEVADTYTSPRLGLNWRFAEHQAVRASVSRNYRVFTAGEQLADYPLVLSDGTYLRQLVRSTGPGLSPERLDSVEFGYLVEWPARRLSLDLTLFHEEMRDEWAGLRDPERTSVFTDKGGRWTTRGLEAQLQFRPDRDTLLFGSYAYAQTDGWEYTQIDADGTRQGRQSLNDTTPRHTLALQVSRAFNPGWQASAAVYHLSDMRWLGEGGSVDAYTRVDAKLSKTIDWGGNQAQIAFILQNLTGDEYDEFRPDYVFEKRANVFERRAFLQLSMQWPPLSR
jgi:iron complex outermembrane receptor protein